MVAQIRPRMGPVQPLQGEDPNVHLREGQQIQQGFGALSRLANQATTYFQELEQDQASADMSTEYSDWYTEATSKPFMTADEARDMGYAGGDLGDRDDVELWEVLPELAKQKYDTLTEKYGDKISGYGKRQEWKNRRKTASAEMYSEMKATQVEETFKRAVEKQKEAYDKALLNSDYDMAYQLASNHPDPTVRQELMDEAQKQGTTDSFHRAIQTENPEVMEEQADWIRGGGADGVLTEAEQTNWIKQLENAAAETRNKNQAERSFEVDKERALLEVAVDNGKAGLADIDEFARRQYAAGSPLPAGWLAGQYKKYNEAYQERMERVEYMNLAALAASGKAITDPTDNKTVQGVNDYAQQIMMEDTDKDGNPVPLESRLARVVDLAKNTNILPDVLSNILRAPANEQMEPQDLMAAVSVYHQIYTTKPTMMDQIPDESKLLLATAWTHSRGGMPTPEAIQEWRNQIASVEPDVRRHRQNKVTQAKTSGDLMNEFKDRSNKHQTLWQFLPFTDNFLGSDRMYLDWEARVNYYAVLGGDSEGAYEAAWRDVSGVYGPTEIGGPNRMIKFPPEMVYNVPAETLESDLHDFVSSVDSSVKVNDIRIVSHSGSSVKPTYQVYVYDKEINMAVPMRNPETFQNVVWNPNFEAMTEKERLDSIEKARKDRQKWKDKDRHAEAQASLPLPLPVGDPVATDPNLADRMDL